MFVCVRKIQLAHRELVHVDANALAESRLCRQLGGNYYDITTTDKMGSRKHGSGSPECAIIGGSLRFLFFWGNRVKYYYVCASVRAVRVREVNWWCVNVCVGWCTLYGCGSAMRNTKRVLTFAHDLVIVGRTPARVCVCVWQRSSRCVAC